MVLKILKFICFIMFWVEYHNNNSLYDGGIFWPSFTISQEIITNFQILLKVMFYQAQHYSTIRCGIGLIGRVSLVNNYNQSISVHYKTKYIWGFDSLLHPEIGIMERLGSKCTNLVLLLCGRVQDVYLSGDFKNR